MQKWMILLSLRLIQPFLNGKMRLTAFPAKNRKKLARAVVSCWEA